VSLWVYAIIFGIVVSGYMAVRTAAKERAIDEAMIEKEGEVYMERIRQAQMKRQRSL
jgi:hypothetical protein